MTTGAVLAGGNPGRTPNLPLPDPYTAAMCGTDIGDVTVSVDAATFNEYIKVFTYKDGSTRLQFNGYLAQTVVGNGKTLHFNASGPGAIFLTPDNIISRIVTQGHLFYIGPPGSPQQGLFLYTGRTVLVVLPDGIAVVSSYSGNRTDVCALLAA